MARLNVENVKMNDYSLGGYVAQVQEELDSKMRIYKQAQWERGDITNDEYLSFLNNEIGTETDLKQKAELEDARFTVKEDVDNTAVYKLYKDGMVSKDAYLASQEQRLSKYKPGSAMYNKITREVDDLRQEVKTEKTKMNDTLKDSQYESGAINDVQYTDYLRGRATEEAGLGNTLAAFEFNDKARTVEWTAVNEAAKTEQLIGKKSPLDILDIMRKNASEYAPGSTQRIVANNAIYKYEQDILNTYSDEEFNTLQSRYNNGELTPEQYRLGVTRLIAKKENPDLEAKVAAERKVDEIYYNQFGRKPDPSGRTMWASRLLEGEDPKVLEAEIARSEEATNRANGIVNGVPANLPQDFGYGYPGGQTAWYSEHTKSIQNAARELLNRELTANEVQQYATSEADISKVRLDLQKLAQGGTSTYGVNLSQTGQPTPTQTPTTQTSATSKPVTQTTPSPATSTITPASQPTPSNKSTLEMYNTAVAEKFDPNSGMYKGLKAHKDDAGVWRDFYDKVIPM